MTIDRKMIQILFDCAVNSMDFGSGFLDDEEVEGLRAVAVLLDLDPKVGTPSNFLCKYEGRHEPYGAGYSYGAGYCSRCRKSI